MRFNNHYNNDGLSYANVVTFSLYSFFVKKDKGVHWLAIFLGILRKTIFYKKERNQMAKRQLYTSNIDEYLNQEEYENYLELVEINDWPGKESFTYTYDDKYPDQMLEYISQIRLTDVHDFFIEDLQNYVNCNKGEPLFMVQGKAGRWNGTTSGVYDATYQTVYDAYTAIISNSDFNDIEVYTENSDLIVVGMHHDGRNYYRIRQYNKSGLTYHLGEDLAYGEGLLEKVYVHYNNYYSQRQSGNYDPKGKEKAEQLINRYTRGIAYAFK